MMKEQLEAIRLEAENELAKVNDAQGLEALRVRYLGKKGALTAILKQMGTLSAEERPAMGQLANEVRAFIEQDIVARQAEIKQLELQNRLENATLDVTMPGTHGELGA